jgi:ubiquinone/menaquinone biosynthesis C-methylase UbiE
MPAAREQESVEAARRRFDRWAGRYEKDRRSRWMVGMQERALDALELRGEDRVLDVGCGTGAAVRCAARVVGRAVRVDLSPAMIERARTWPDLPSNIQFRVGESGRLPVQNGEFTAMLCTNSFHHYPDPDTAAREMARALEPGGRIVIGDGCADVRAARVADWFLRRFEPGHVRLYRSGELGDILRAAGFDHVQVRRLWDGSYVFVRGVKP